MKQAPVCVALVGLALVACSDTTPPDSGLPSAPAIAAAPPVGPCSFKDAQTYAKAYFATSALKNAAAGFLRSAQDAPAGSPARNNFLIEVLKLIAQARDANQAKAPLDGAKLHAEVLECGAFVVSDDRDHLAVVTSALTDGAYAYREASEGFVATENQEVAAEPASGIWGVGGWVGGRTIVFAGKVSVDFDETEVDEGETYRWGIVYDATPPGSTPGPLGDDDALIVEFCPLDLEDEPAYRVGRARGTGLQAVLQEEDIALFCDGVASTRPPSGFLARALQEMIGFFTPSPLQARILAPPGVGGGTGGLGSDFALLHAGFVQLAFVTQPPDGTTTPGIIHFEVRALAANNTPLENVVLLVTVDGNQGQPVTLTGGCQPTDEAGLASCDVSIDKTGGYRLRVTSDFDGYAPVFIISQLFNLMQN